MTTSNPETTPVEVPAPTPVTTDAVGDKLKSLGVADDVIGIIKGLGADSLDELNALKEKDLTDAGVKPLKARAIMEKLNPVAAASAAAPASPEEVTREFGETENPTKGDIDGFANMLGGNNMALMMLMSGGMIEGDVSGMIPIAQVVAGYTPKRRDMYFMVMGQLERRIGVPIVIIDANGAINKPLTVQYIEALEEGHQPATDNLYYDTDGQPHEVIRVGVDAQSVYDSDPLIPTQPLQKNGMGTGRINWTNVPPEVRQVAYYAATQTHEIDPANDAHMSWMREKMKPGANRLVFSGQAPKAVAAFNEAARTGSLPTLRTMLTRSARRPEFMPRRRRTVPRDLSGIGRIGGGDGLDEPEI